MLCKVKCPHCSQLLNDLLMVTLQIWISVQNRAKQDCQGAKYGKLPTSLFVTLFYQFNYQYIKYKFQILQIL